MRPRFLALLLPLLNLLSFSAFAIDENKIASDFQSKILPWFLSQARFAEFKGERGVRVNYAQIKTPGATRAIVISPGRTEPFIKYAEFIYDIRNLGYDITLIDHRGQGSSERMVSNSQIGYVDEFSDYIKDLKTLFDTEISHYPKRFLLAHSMGGGIASLYGLTYPGDFDAMVLFAPMLELNTGKYSEPVAHLITRVECQLGNARHYAIGQKDWDPQLEFEKNDVTQSKARFEMSQQIFADHPDMVLGGPSNRWVLKALDATRYIRKNGENFKTPVLLFQAEKDKIVKLNGQRTFCSKASQCSIVLMKDSAHEILMERDFIRNNAMQLAFDFLGRF